MTMPKPTHTIQADGIRLSVFHTKVTSSANDVSIMIERDQGRSGEAWYPTATIRGDDLHALGKAVHEVLLLLSTSNGSGKPLSPPTPRTVVPAVQPSASVPAPVPVGSGSYTAEVTGSRDASVAAGQSPREIGNQDRAAVTPQAETASSSKPLPQPTETPNPPSSITATSSLGKVSVPQPTGSTSAPRSPTSSPTSSHQPSTPSRAAKPAMSNRSKAVQRAVAATVGKRRGR